MKPIETHIGPVVFVRRDANLSHGVFFTMNLTRRLGYTSFTAPIFLLPTLWNGLHFLLAALMFLPQ